MNNFSEMVANFHQAHQSQVLIPPVKIQSAGPKKFFPRQYIYSWKALPELIKQLREESKNTFDLEEDRNDRLGLRYVVDRNGHVWFAREGEESSSVPTHSEMVDGDDVYTSGSIFFSENYKTIVEITNKSGHFLPEFQTIVSFLTVLFSLENNPAWAVSIAPQVKLVKYQKQASQFTPAPIDSMTVSKEELRSALQDLVAPVLEYPYARFRKIDPENTLFTMFEILETNEQYTAHKHPPVSENSLFSDCDFSFDFPNNSDVNDAWNFGYTRNHTSSSLSRCSMFSSNTSSIPRSTSPLSLSFPLKRTKDQETDQNSAFCMNLSETISEQVLSNESEDAHPELSNTRSPYTVSDNSLFTSSETPPRTSKRLRPQQEHHTALPMHL